MVKEAGIIFTAAALVDTLVVRTLLVPACGGVGAISHLCATVVAPQTAGGVGERPILGENIEV